MKKLTALLIIFMSFMSTAQTCNTLQEVQWILGNWQNNDKNTITKEHWQQVSNNTFEGGGETFVEAKIKNSESLRLVLMSGELFYIAKVSHNMVPVAFALTDCRVGYTVFENHQHDFPKRIEYTLVEKNTMKVTVSDGADKGFSIVFVKE